MDPIYSLTYVSDRTWKFLKYLLNNYNRLCGGEGWGHSLFGKELFGKFLLVVGNYGCIEFKIFVLFTMGDSYKNVDRRMVLLECNMDDKTHIGIYT